MNSLETSNEHLLVRPYPGIKFLIKLSFANGQQQYINFVAVKQP